MSEDAATGRDEVVARLEAGALEGLPCGFNMGKKGMHGGERLWKGGIDRIWWGKSLAVLMAENSGLPLQGAWVQSLVGELRSCKPCGAAKTKTNQDLVIRYGHWGKREEAETTSCLWMSLCGPESSNINQQKKKLREAWFRGKESPCLIYTEIEMVKDIKLKMPHQEVGNVELKPERSGLKMWGCLWHKDHIKLQESRWAVQWDGVESLAEGWDWLWRSAVFRS